MNWTPDTVNTIPNGQAIDRHRQQIMRDKKGMPIERTSLWNYPIKETPVLVWTKAEDFEENFTISYAHL